ncbi:MAG: polyphosphate kinase 1, partial [Bacteroidia bacterium]|nr:polyphosphate kinase 1 [Bacteroidia bacterium]
MKIRFFERDLSWLSFNHRVLQEASDISVPLLERIKFLAIFSSNLEEYYRVRVANYYRLAQIEKKESPAKLSSADDPEILIEKINRIVDKQQQEFGRIFYEEIIPALRKDNVIIIQRTSSLNGKQLKKLRKIYKELVAPHLELMELNDDSEVPFLINTQVYFLIRVLIDDNIRYFFCRLPVDESGRFIDLKRNTKQFVIQIDDVIRHFLSEEIGGAINCYAIKVTRDAELYLDEEFEGSMVDRIKRSLLKRETGSFTRMLYDESMPDDAIKFLRNYFSLKKRNLVKGGRYHNFYDFFSFPKIEKPHLYYKELPQLEHVDIENSTSIKELILKKDVLLHYPYHKFDYAVQFVKQAIEDSSTKHIYIS